MTRTLSDKYIHQQGYNIRLVGELQSLQVIEKHEKKKQAKVGGVLCVWEANMNTSLEKWLLIRPLSQTANRVPLASN